MWLMIMQVKLNFASILLYEAMLFSIYNNFTFLKIIYNAFEDFIILSLIILIFILKKKEIRAYVNYVKINSIHVLSLFINTNLFLYIIRNSFQKQL